MSEQDLGMFIRKQRERLRPDELGLRSVGRRRTPGLRREELALLCGVSPTWITWLEQGRPVRASEATLLQLADVLRLSEAERHYLFGLAGRLAPDAVAGESGAEAVLRSVAQIDCPAYVLDRSWNVLASNDAALELLGDWLALPAPNLLRYTFLDPAALRLIDDWPVRARRLVAEFRADCGRHLDDAAVQALIQSLAAQSPDFARYWQDQAVLPREGGIRRFHHAEGRRVLQQTTFQAALRPDLKLVLLMPGERENG